LRDEFEFRCVFCLRREQWDRAATLEIEHFQPTARNPSGKLDYENLLYACSRCNSAKGVCEVPDPTTSLLAEMISMEPARVGQPVDGV
jgi:5-methylcytosine-specific restriction endonuclease McrA